MNIRDIVRTTLRKSLRNRPRAARPPRLEVTQLEDRVVPAAPIQFFYVPMPEAQVNAAFDTIITNTTISATQESITVLTVTEDGTTVWYDQWEDGYEAILGTPRQATTQVWGDNNDTNGIAPGFAADPAGLASGTVIKLRNTVNVPRNLATQPLLYDSPDKFGADKTLAVSRAQFPTTYNDPNNGGAPAGGSVISSAVEVRDTRFYDTAFTAPVGTNTPNATRGGENSMFSYAAFYVQAFLDNTRVQIDANADGDFADAADTDVVLNQGQTVVSSAGVVQGARVVASKPVQADLLTGQVGGTYASRTYALFSDAQATNDYFTPVGFGGTGDSTDEDDVRLYVFNPNTFDIRVRRENAAGTDPFVLVPAGTGAMFTVTTNTGTRLFTVDAANTPVADKFLALGVHDAPGGSTAVTHDWGFSLQPKAALSQIAIVGLGIGNSNNPPSGGSGAGNFSPVFVTALVPVGQPNTTLFIDHNNDGTVDQTLVVTRLQSVRLRDTTTDVDPGTAGVQQDFDNSGLRVYTTDGTLISVAWGEDGTAPTGSPGLDAGTTVPAVPVPEYYKFSTFVPGPTGDVNGDGFFNEGDTIRYSLRVRHIGTTPISNAVVTDALPLGQVTYLPNSTVVTSTIGAVTTVTPLGDDAVGTAFPLDGTGYTIVNLDPNQTVTVTFDAVINSGLPPGFNFILNQSVLAYDIFRLPANDVIDLRGTVGDRVWYDANGDGVQDAGEPGIPGATVTLTWYGPDGLPGGTDNQTFTTTTDAAGLWSITNLPAGTFATSATVPAGLGLTVQTGGPPTMVLPSGQVNRTDIDFGFRGTGRIGDFVWADTNANGLQDAGEPGLAGATVTLTWAGFDGAFGTGDEITYPSVTTTAGTNNYGFANLPAGNFQAAITPPTGGTISPRDAGANDAVDNDFDPTTGRTLTIALAAGATNVTVDAGVRMSADLRVTKTDGTTTAVPGTSLTYTITVTNAGPANVVGASLADSIPATLTGVTWTSAINGTAGVTAGAAGSGNALAATVDLPAGVGNSVVFTVTGTVSAAATGSLANTATVTAPPGIFDPTPGNNTDTDTDTLTPQADLAITKDNGVAAVIPGQSVTYTIVVTNLGPSNVTGATVADSIPAALTGVTWTSTTTGTAAVTAGASGSVNALGATVNVAAGAGNAVTFTVMGTLNPTFTGTLANTATVTAPAGVTDPTGNNSATDSDPATPRADLAITKDNGVAAVIPGTSVTYTIVVTNTGPSNVTGATVADSIPVALTGVTWSSTTAGTAAVTTGATGSGNALAATVNIASGAGNSVTFTVTGTVSAAATGTLTNTATVTAPGGVTDPTPGNNSATDTDTLTPRADLAITKDNGVAAVIPGTSVTYTIVVTNAGPSDVTGATVADTIPAALTGVTWTSTTTGTAAVTAGASGSVNALGATVNVAAGAGNAVTFTVMGTLNPTFTGTLANTATVTAPAGVTDPPGNNSATDSDPATPRADLVVTKTDGGATAVPGGLVTYTITVANNGPSASGAITLTDAVPANTTFDSATGGGSPAGGVVTWALASLAPNTSTQVTVTFRVAATVAAGVTQLTNSASATGTVTDPVPGNNSGGDTTPLTAAPDLRVTKTDPGTPAVPGALVTYTITVFNDGNQGATGVTLTETVPANTVFIAAGSDAAWDPTGTTLGVGGLAAGASRSFTYQVRVNAPFPVGTSQITNVVDVADDGTNGPDPTPPNNRATRNTPVAGGRIGDRVFLDANGNGIQDGGELGVQGVTVQLLDGTTSAVLDTQVTDAAGTYQFVNLSGGTYRVSFGTTDGTRTFAFSAPAQGADPTADSDPAATGLTPLITLAAGQLNDDIDAGVFVPVTIGDTVFFDADGNGTQGAEPGIAGITVALYYAGPDGAFDPADLAAPFRTTTTTAGGLYAFAGLAPGNYRVAVNATQPALAALGMTSATTAATQPTTVVSGVNDLARDFGFRGTGSLGDRVWLDRDGDGAQGPTASEPGLPRVAVGLTWLGFDGAIGGGDDVTYPGTLTDGAGLYGFANLPAGAFRVTVGPAGLPGDLTPTAGAPAVSLTAGQALTTADFGYRGGATIGDQVWYDVDGDGTRNNDEPGLPGVTVTVLSGGADGDLATTADNFTVTVVTDADGRYTVAGLPGGNGTGLNYRVTVTPAAGYGVPTFDADGTATPNTSALRLGAGATNDLQDFGYRGTGSVGDTVFEDRNGNGRFDAGEPGLPGVTVRLYDATGTRLLAVTTTAGTGTYTFPGLAAGDYRVQFGTPAGFTPTVADRGTDDADSDAGAGGFTAVVTVATGATVTDVDAGFYRPVSVGDRVWFDANGNGVDDGGEPGVPGATITLTWLGPDGAPNGGDDQQYTATTGANGLWSVGSLPPGNYTAVVSGLPNGVTVPTADPDGTGTPNTAAFALTSGVSRDDIDFGYAAAGSIGDRVWLDRNGNGVQDAGEPGLPGLSVSVTWLGFDGAAGGGDDVTFPAVTTGANGAYTVTGLPTGAFVVTVSPAGTNLVSTFDPDGSAADGTATIVLTSGAPSTTAADFGFRGTASVGDLVFQDIDRDGALDAGELGLPGVAVTIRWAGGDGALDTGDDATFTTTTDAAGAYTFAGLPVYGASDPYRVTIAAPAGYAATGDLDGPGTPNAAAFVLGPTDARTDADFALGGAAGQSLAGSVYHDLNGDGDRDAGEPGLSGVTVRLSGTDAFGRTIVNPATGQPFFDVATLADGSYLFDFLVPGTYTLAEPVQPAAYGDGLEAAGTLNGTAGNDVVSGIVLAAGAAGTGYTFGELGATISGTVFRDDDRDGTRTGTEPGIAGVVLTLQDNAGNPVIDPATGAPFTATTGPTGAYSFTNVPAGSYRIVEAQPAGYANGPVGPATVRAVTLTPAGLASQDFAEVLARIGGTVYVDRNANSSLNGGEPGIGGVTVTLSGTDQFGAPVSLTTQTAGDGTYTFDNLFPANATGYTIDEGPVPTLNDGGPNAPGTAAGAAAGPNRFTGVAPAAGQQAGGYNFAEVGVAVGGTVFVDLNRDGSRGPADPPLANVTVELLDAGGAVVATAVTGPDGAYLFTNVLPGTYTVREAQPAGYGNPASGPAAPNTRPITVAAAPVGGLDFGDTLSSLSGVAYLDANRSGGRDAGEPGIGGVVVTLSGTDATGATVTRTTTTAADGGYRFDGVLAGTYTLTETQPTSFADGADAAGRVNAVSLGTVGNDVVSGIALAAGADYAGQLFGEEPPPAPTLGTTFLAGTVYRDANTNGVLDGGETGIAGVTVELRGPGGTVLQTAVTRADGTYLFLNVAAGTYTVAEPTQPAGLGSTTPDVLTVTVPAGPTPVVNVNFGEAPTSISGRAYLDLNASGTPDAGEPGLGGVLVTLTGTDAGGQPVTRTATTAADGTFQFTDLPPGTFTVTETQPTGLPDGADLAGSNGVAGNDVVSVITLAAGAAATGIAFAELPPAGPGLSFITGTVFIDTDRDGTQDQNEAPIPGVTVELLGPDGATVVATTQTGPDGRYAFPDLPGGTYFVREVQPAGLASTSPNLLPVSIDPARPATAVSFGEVAGSITGSVYQDLNLNGVRDPGESGIGGAVVTLTGPGGFTQTATTDADGNYRFDGLADGNYVLTEAQPAGYADGQDRAGNAGGTPAAGDAIPGITLVGGAAAAGYTFGELGTNSVSGTVYADNNMNGVFDPAGNDTGYRPGILILLTGTDAGGNLVTRSTRTAANGSYTFAALPAGTYRVVEDQPNLPTTAAPPDGVYDGADNPGAGGSVAAKNQLAVTLTGDGARPPQNATDFNFGELPPADPFGFAFEDRNGNGRFDAGEPGLPGVTVTISGTAFAGTPAARPLAPADLPGGMTIATDANGRYEFNPVPPGLYAITLTTGPGGALTLFRLENADPNAPAPTVGATAFTNIVQNPLPIRGPLNFGFVRPVSLAGSVYLDANGNGARDAADPGVGGVAVRLTGADGLGAAVSLTTRTAADGSYAFPGLLPGVYDVTETQPANLFQGVNTPGTAGGTTAVTDVIGRVTLTSGTAATGYLFGERPAAPLPATPLPPLTPPADPPMDVSKRMFLTTTPDAVVLPATGRMVPDFAALGSVSTTRNPEFFATAEGAGGDLIRVFDLTAGTERFRFRPFPGNPGGVRVAVADLTGDGIPDIAAAAGPGGGPRVIVYDGNTGGVLFDFMAFEMSFSGGVFVAAGDIDRDGRADLVVTPDVGGGPRARVLSGGNPTRVIADMLAIDDPAFRGGIRPAVGDVNGDGAADMVVTAGAGGGPRVAVWDGATLAGAPARLVPDFFAFEATLRDGAYLAVGDVDRDGAADLIVGAGPGGAPRVVTFLSADLFAGRVTPAASFLAGDGADRGGVPVAAADVDGDGAAEVVSGAGVGSFPRVRLTDPRTGRVLDEFAAQYMAFRGGVFIG